MNLTLWLVHVCLVEFSIFILDSRILSWTLLSTKRYWMLTPCYTCAGWSPSGGLFLSHSCLVQLLTWSFGDKWKRDWWKLSICWGGATVLLPYSPFSSEDLQRILCKCIQREIEDENSLLQTERPPAHAKSVGSSSWERALWYWFEALSIFGNI